MKPIQNSLRVEYIKKTRKDAVEHGTCKEEYYGGKIDVTESGCQYPYCHCLYGTNGPIDPQTGKEIES